MTEIHDPRLEAPRRILVPVDLSPLSYQGLDLARHLGGAACAIRLFHAQAPVYSLPPYTTEAMAPLYDEALTRAQMAEARKALDTRRSGGAEDVKVVEAAIAAEAIAEDARSYGADLVVMTTHGRGGLTALFSGSVAQKLFHIYSGPIVLLRPQKRAPRPEAAL